MIECESCGVWAHTACLARYGRCACLAASAAAGLWPSTAMCCLPRALLLLPHGGRHISHLCPPCPPRSPPSPWPERSLRQLRDRYLYLCSRCAGAYGSPLPGSTPTAAAAEMVVSPRGVAVASALAARRHAFRTGAQGATRGWAVEGRGPGWSPWLQPLSCWAAGAAAVGDAARRSAAAGCAHRSPANPSPCVVACARL